MVPHGYMCRLRIRAPAEHHEMREHLQEMWSSWCAYCKKKSRNAEKCSLHPREKRQHRLGTNVPRMRSVHEALHNPKSRKQRADTDMMLRSVIIGSQVSSRCTLNWHAPNQHSKQRSDRAQWSISAESLQNPGYQLRQTQRERERDALCGIRVSSSDTDSCYNLPHMHNSKQTCLCLSCVACFSKPLPPSLSPSYSLQERGFQMSLESDTLRFSHLAYL